MTNLNILFKRLLILFVPFCVLNILIYFSSPYYIEQKDYHTMIDNLFKKDSVKTIYLGDSHVVGLKNDYLDNYSYNLAFGGDGIKEMYLKLKYILSKPNTIETLILSADYQMFSRRRVHSANRNFLSKYVIALNEYSVYESNFVSELIQFVPLFSDNYVEYFNTWLKKKSSAIFFPEHSKNINDSLNINENYWSQLDIKERKKRAELMGINDHTGILESESLQNYYKQLIDLANANHIAVIGVQYPVEAEYLKQCPEKSRKMMDDFFRKLEWSQFYDFSNLFNQPSYFRNEDHMNTKGVKRLLFELEKVYK